MAKHIVIVGFGPGISNAVAHRFGAAGFSVSVVARNPYRRSAGAPGQGPQGGSFPG